MKNTTFRSTSLLLALCLLLGCIALPAQADNPGGVEYLNTHVNTGNQRQDIVAVAMTQLGYEEKFENDTKYGDWYGFPGYAWCAMFVAWCARQAEIPTDILTQHSWAHPNAFDVPYYHGREYTPKPGDLFFTEDFGHMGLVWYVDGEFFYCVEGNAKYHDYTVPNDPTVDSYHVMTNKRLISAHYFGVPAYLGSDREHSYVRGVESEHPHRIYFRCQLCGDQYYNGYTECVSECSQCLSCGCSAEYAGFYLVTSQSDPVNMRKKHSASSESIGYATVGEAVYVYGADPVSGRAYIEYDGHRGHVWLRYLTKYKDIPAAPEVTSEKAEYTAREAVSLSWSLPEHTEQFRMQIFRDGALWEEKLLEPVQSCTLEPMSEGNYEIRVTACNRAGFSDAGTVTFSVRNTYTLSYDAAGGSDAPAAQTQVMGQSVTVADAVPVRDGYAFLGWTDKQGSPLASYQPGAELTPHDSVTLYAVWKQADAAAQSLTVRKLPDTLLYLPGEALALTGLELELRYSDGSGFLVEEGWQTEGFDSESTGTKTVTVSLDGLTASFEVQVVPHIPGDIDLNKSVDRDDVMGLLWHISFPERFAVTVPADFNGDGLVNRDDVMQLLWHIAVPDRFPLCVAWPDIPAQGNT